MSKQSKTEQKSETSSSQEPEQEVAVVKKRPQMTGEIATGSYERGNYKQIGRISFWIQERNIGTKYPLFQGNFEIGDGVDKDTHRVVNGKKFYGVVWLYGWHLVKD